MTQDEIIELAKQCGIVIGYPKYQDIEAFAKLVAEKEREKVTKERDRMCEHCKWRNNENSTLNETN